MTERQDTAVRQEQIVRAALRLIGQHGISRVNVAAVAKQVGLVPSAIYRHFPNKDAVIEAVLDLVREQLLDNVRLATTERTTAPERLEYLLRLHLDMLRENQGFLRVIFSEAVYGGPAARRAKVFRTMQAYLQAVAQIAREGQRAGTIRQDVEPTVVAAMFLGLVQPVALVRMMSGGVVDASGQAQAGWRVLRGAIERA
jgi:AcrR family transcriptional regulator